MPIHYIIRSRDGRHWQTSRGFMSTNPTDATKYDSKSEAEMVLGFCVPARSLPAVHEVRS